MIKLFVAICGEVLTVYVRSYKCKYLKLSMYFIRKKHTSNKIEKAKNSWCHNFSHKKVIIF